MYKLIQTITSYIIHYYPRTRDFGQTDISFLNIIKYNALVHVEYDEYYDVTFELFGYEEIKNKK